MAVNAASSVRVVNTDSDVPVARRPSRWVRRLISRVVLAVGLLLTAMGVAILLACTINDGAINSSRGESVGEVMDTSPTRTVVRFIDDKGHVYIPDNGVLYPAGLQVHQLVRVEYDSRNPELVRVAGRSVTVALLPVFSAMAGLWAVWLPSWWFLRRWAAR